MVLGQYLGSNPQRQYDPPQQLSTCHPGPSGNTTLFMNRHKPHTVVTNRKKHPSLFAFFDTQDLFLWLFIWQEHHAITKEDKAWGIFKKTPLQFSSMLVKLQKRSQQGTSEHSYQSTAAILLLCLSTLLPCVIGIIVRLELGTNWASSWRVWAVSLKGHVSGGAPGDT